MNATNTNTENLLAQDIDIVGEQPVLALISTATGEEQSGILFVDSSRENNMAEINSSLDATGGNQLVFSIDDGVSGPQERLTVNGDGITVNGDIAATDLVVEGIITDTMGAATTTTSVLNAVDIDVENLLAQDIDIIAEEPVLALISTATGQEESAILFADSNEDSMATMVARLDATGNSELVFSVDDGVTGPQECLTINSAGDVTVDGTLVVGELKTIAASSVTQSTDKTTGVIIDSTAGSITTASSQLNAGATAKFKVTNNAITENHIINVNVAFINGAAYSGTYVAVVTNVTNGSFEIIIENVGTTGASETVRLNFFALELGF